MKLDLDNHLTALVLWLSNKMTSGASRAYREKFDLGITEWRVLSYIEIFPWSTGAQVCELIGLDKAAVSRSFVSLGDRNLVVSRPLGRRRVEYSTTPAGTELFNSVLEISLAKQEALLTGFSESERKMLINFLHRLLDNLPFYEAAPAASL